MCDGVVGWELWSLRLLGHELRADDQDGRVRGACHALGHRPQPSSAVKPAVSDDEQIAGRDGVEQHIDGVALDDLHLRRRRLRVLAADARMTSRHRAHRHGEAIGEVAARGERLE